MFQRLNSKKSGLGKKKGDDLGPNSKTLLFFSLKVRLEKFESLSISSTVGHVEEIKGFHVETFNDVLSNDVLSRNICTFCM